MKCVAAAERPTKKPPPFPEAALSFTHNWKLIARSFLSAEQRRHQPFLLHRLEVTELKHIIFHEDDTIVRILWPKRK